MSVNPTKRQKQTKRNANYKKVLFDKVKSTKRRDVKSFSSILLSDLIRDKTMWYRTIYGEVSGILYFIQLFGRLISSISNKARNDQFKEFKEMAY